MNHSTMSHSLRHPAEARRRPALWAVLGLTLLHATATHAADTVLRPAAGESVLIQSADGSRETLRVQDDGKVFMPGINAAAQQNARTCHDPSTGQLGPCTSSAPGTPSAVVHKNVTLTDADFAVTDNYTGITSDGTFSGWRGKSSSISVPAITQDVLDNGAVLVYMERLSFEAPGSIVPLPWATSYLDHSIHWRYAVRLGAVVLETIVEADTGASTAAPNISGISLATRKYRIVVIPSSGPAD